MEHKEFEILDIISVGSTQDNGKFYIETKTTDLLRGKKSITYFEIDFSMFYKWFDEDTMLMLKEAYVERYLKLKNFKKRY